MNWKCPLSQDNNCPKNHAIALDGGLRHVQSLYIDELKNKGWKFIMNPKRNYYYEFDQTSPHYKAEETQENENNDVLKVEII